MFLMAYFRTEQEADGEQVRLAVSGPDDPLRWTPVDEGRPVLVSDVGEGGVRDPFLLRHDDGRIILIATDLRVHPEHDWARAMTRGSRAILVWETRDLLTWEGPRRVGIAPPGAGNAWAPKAFWSRERGSWLVIWASGMPGEGSDHQRLLCAATRDFRTFGEPEVYLDPGHDIIDATFLQVGDDWFRFTANVYRPGLDPLLNHIRFERGRGLEDPDFTVLDERLGSAVLHRGEGPAAFSSADGSRHYLLIDEFGMSGYHLFESGDPASGWRHRPDARLPVGARHGSVLPISAEEGARLLGPAQP
ncbi:hypothetical protein BH09ACT5_BH09ACT5_10290 [soil metagenome]